MFLYSISRLSADLVVLTALVITFAGLVVSHGAKIKWYQSGVGLPIVIIVFLVGMAFVRWLVSRMSLIGQLRVVFRDWVPFLLIAFVYENLHDLSDRIGNHNIAPLMFRLDQFLFGVQLTVFAEKFCSPLLTDIMALFYALWLALPLILMLVLSLTHRRKEFQKISLAVAFTFVMGFILYVIFPCLPPRFYVTDYTVSLSGAFLHYHLQHMWDNLSGVKGAAFPSMHVALSSVALIYTYRFRRISSLLKVLWILFIPIAVGLWLSTVYLRHHWMGDILAGWGVAATAAYLADRALAAREKFCRQLDILRTDFSLKKGGRSTRL